MNDGLPQGWTIAQLGDLIQARGLFDGPFGSNLKTSDYTTAGVRVIRLENIGHLRFIEDKQTYISLKKYESLTKHTVSAGDIIVGSFVDGAVRVCVLPSLATKVIAKADCFCVRTCEALVDRRFVAYQLGSSQTRDALIEHIHGATRPRITTRQLRDTQLLIAPRAEQARIAEQLDRSLANVDGCQRRLARIPILLRRFRQSVLAAAGSGQLTVDWRNRNPDVEAAPALARRIDEERRQRVTGRAPFAAVEILKADDCPEDEIPSTWTWIRFGSAIGELRNGVSPRPNIEPPGTPILRISAARPGSVDLKDVRYMPGGARFLPLFAVREDDLLFTRYNGSIELLGVCGRVRGLGRKSLLYPDKLMRVRFDHGMVLPAYAEIFFQVPAVHERIVAKSKSSAGQNGVSGTDIKRQPFALPPIREQEEIIRRVEALFARGDQIGARCVKARTYVDKLTASLLSKAFRGELVPTEAECAEREGREYEPASVLLDRIQRAHVGHEAASVGRRRNKPAGKTLTKRTARSVGGRTSKQRYVAR